MNKTTYAMQIAKEVNGDVREVQKLNGVTLTGITIKADTNVSPTIYIDKMYEEGLTVNQAVQAVLECYERNKRDNMDLSVLNDFQKAKAHLKIRLLNGSNEFDVQRKAPAPFEDLIIVPYLEDIIENGSTRVTRKLIGAWDVFDDDVFNQAIINTQLDIYFKPMFEVLSELMPFADLTEEESPKMYVCSNQSKCYGAAAVLFMRYNMKKQFPEGCYVIPSSVHETLIVPADLDKDELDEIITEVNSTTVSREDFLSDHAYKVVFHD